MPVSSAKKHGTGGKEALTQLKGRLLLAIMIVSAFLLACMSAAICAIYYFQALDDAYGQLRSAAIESGFGGRTEFGGDRLRNEFSIVRDGYGYEDRQALTSGDHDALIPDSEGIPDVPTDDPGMPFIGGRDGDAVSIPVAVYKVENGNPVLMESASTAILEEGVLDDAWASVESSGDMQGILASEGLVFVRTALPGGQRIAFTDSSVLDGWKYLALILSGASLVLLAIVLFASLILLSNALKPVQEAWERQRRFIADASHEFKTPLAVVAANNAILQEHAEMSVASQSKWVESTGMEVEGMSRLIDDMLVMASLDEGASDPQLQDTDLSRLVEGQILQMESIAYESSIDLESDIDDGLRVYADPSHARRIVRTLLENAMKYTPAAGSVFVSLVSTSGRCVLKVVNTGDGIPQEDLSHIFDRFYRTDQARDRKSGFGLGLSIAYGLAKANGAEIKASSISGESTTFEVEWPMG